MAIKENRPSYPLEENEPLDSENVVSVDSTPKKEVDWVAVLLITAAISVLTISIVFI